MTSNERRRSTGQARPPMVWGMPVFVDPALAAAQRRAQAAEQARAAERAMFWRKNKQQMEVERFKQLREQQEKYGCLKLTLVEETEHRFKLDHGISLMYYLNGYIYDLVLADMIYHLLKEEISTVWIPAWTGELTYELATNLEIEQINSVYPPDTLIRSNEQVQTVIAFNPIGKDLIAEEVIERCEGHEAASRMDFYALVRTPEELRGWPAAELKKLQDLENWKFRIFAGEDWETVYFEINPQFCSKKELIASICETLAQYNITLEVQI